MGYRLLRLRLLYAAWPQELFPFLRPRYPMGRTRYAILQCTPEYRTLCKDIYITAPKKAFPDRIKDPAVEAKHLLPSGQDYSCPSAGLRYTHRQRNCRKSIPVC